MSSTRAPDRQAVIQGLGPVRRFGRYLLVKKLAVGGMAEIWLALQESVAGFKRFVVVKKILGHLIEREEFVSMFLDEARTTVQLNHPNIVKVYDLGEADGSYFLSMEYIDGETLAALTLRAARKRTPITPELAARIIADAARALHFAHTLKGHDGRNLAIIHRDISPQNILLSYEGEVKVVDFGIAKAASQSEHTQAGMLKGKYSYMSPEQIQGQPLDGRSDVFALAITLYELVTGTRLFKHDSELMILEMVTKHEVPPPSSINPMVSTELDQIIAKGLAKDRDQRFASAEAFQVALEEHLSRSEQSTAGHDLGRLMQQLFADHVAEKTLIREIASEPNFEETYSESPPPRAAPRAPIVERRSNPSPAPSVHPSQYPPGYGSQGSYTGPFPVPGGHSGSYSSPGVAYPVPGAQPSKRSAVLLTLFSIMLLLVLGLGTYLILVPGGVTSVPAGALDIVSTPPGALIYLDGERPRGVSGLAVTPTKGELSLPFDKRVKLRLEKPGYKDYEIEVTMTAEQAGRPIEVQLDAHPVPLTIDVDPSHAEVEIKVDGRMLGKGAGLVASVQPEVEHEVTVALEGYECESMKSKIAAGSSGRMVVPCREKRVVSGNEKTLTRRDPKEVNKVREPRPPREPRETAASTACVPDDSRPSGAVFNTKPVSEVFFRGRRLGETPLKQMKLPSGCLEITYQNPVNKKKVVKRYIHAPNRLDYRYNETIAELE